MTIERFNEITKEFIAKTEATLITKQDEYNLGQDRFEFFKHMAKIENCTNEQALVHCVAKHLTSFFDMVDSNEEFTRQRWFEKLGDIVNYMILLYGLLEDGNKFKDENNIKED